jgi:aminoglycoside 6'-N-acetyltransferase
LISFRPLEREDLPLMHRWLNEPHVRRWYYDYDGREPTMAFVVEKYAPNDADPTKASIITVDGWPVGYIQTYLIGDYEPYARAIGVTERAAGIDLFIGEPDMVHRGLGPQIIEAMLEIVFADETIESCIIGPELHNSAAIRCYAKAGFTYLRTATVPGEPQPQFVMRRARDLP